MPPYARPPQPGMFFNLTGLPPVSPDPVLTDYDEAPLPPVTKRRPSGNDTTVQAPSPGNCQPTLAATAIVLCITSIFLFLQLV